MISTIRFTSREMLELPEYDTPGSRFYGICKLEPEHPFVAIPEFDLPTGWRTVRVFQHLGWLMAEFTTTPEPEPASVLVN